MPSSSSSSSSSTSAYSLYSGTSSENATPPPVFSEEEEEDQICPEEQELLDPPSSPVPKFENMEIKAEVDVGKMPTPQMTPPPPPLASFPKIDLEFRMGVPVNPEARRAAEEYLEKSKAKDKEKEQLARKLQDEGTLDLDHFLKTGEVREKPQQKSPSPDKQGFREKDEQQGTESKEEHLAHCKDALAKLEAENWGWPTRDPRDLSRTQVYLRSHARHGTRRMTRSEKKAKYKELNWLLIRTTIRSKSSSDEDKTKTKKNKNKKIPPPAPPPLRHHPPKNLRKVERPPWWNDYFYKEHESQGT